MKKTLFLLAVLGSLSAATLHAQETDVDNGLSFSGRAAVEADAKLAKGLHLSAHEEMRVYSGDNDILRSYTGFGIEYKVLPFLKLGAEYELINRYRFDEDENANVWARRHRGNFSATGTFQTGDWQFGLKETFRITHRPGEMNTWQAPRNALALKSKVSVKYRGWGKVIPYAAFEMKNALNDASYAASYNSSASEAVDRYVNEEFLGYKHAYVSRLRAQLGVTVKFNKHHELDFYLLGDHLKEKVIDTNKESSKSWSSNGLVLKHLYWKTGNMLSGGIGYKWSF